MFAVYTELLIMYYNYCISSRTFSVNHSGQCHVTTLTLVRVTVCLIRRAILAKNPQLLLFCLLQNIDVYDMHLVRSGIHFADADLFV